MLAGRGMTRSSVRRIECVVALPCASESSNPILAARGDHPNRPASGPLSRSAPGGYPVVVAGGEVGEVVGAALVVVDVLLVVVVLVDGAVVDVVGLVRVVVGMVVVPTGVVVDRVVGVVAVVGGGVGRVVVGGGVAEVGDAATGAGAATAGVVVAACCTGPAGT
jgi:hypothetical protein